MVRDSWWSVQLERSEQSLGFSGRGGPSEAKVSRADAPPQGQCAHLLCALELLAKLQTGGGNPEDTILQGVREQSRLKITNEPRRFIEVDDHEAVKIGELENCPERSHPRKGGRTDASNKRSGNAAHLHQNPPRWGTASGGRRSWTRIGTPLVKPSTKASRERNGRTGVTRWWK